MMPVRGSEQCSIGFQSVPRDHCAWPLEISNDLGVAKSRRSIDAGYRLEAYATLLLRLAGSNGGLFSDDQLPDAGFKPCFTNDWICNQYAKRFSLSVEPV
jgi:hypothetical protein